MFRRKPQPPSVTNEAYRRWLRAWRPPFAWFLGLPDADQEQLAILGDERSQDLAVAVGYAVADPSLADAGLAAAAGDAAGEEQLALRLAAGLAERLAKPAAPPKPVPTLAGFGRRRGTA